MEPAPGTRIIILRDGPYQVEGRVPLTKEVIVTDPDGESVAWRETERLPEQDGYMLCRCGKSCDKPYCDMTHAVEGFDGTETADRGTYEERMEVIEGPGVDLCDVKDLCAEARFCAAVGGIWNTVLRAEGEGPCGALAEQAKLCPSGRYTARRKDGELVEPDLEPSIALIEDPDAGVSGPLWVRGGIPIESSEGFTYEVRNRVTLCRCGASKDKPFCDGTHCEIDFRDWE